MTVVDASCCSLDIYKQLKNKHLSGAEGFTPEQDVEEVRQIEKQIRKRFAIGTQVILIVGMILSKEHSIS